ncbi:MAG: HAD family hydrolase [Candidatus Thorarchaeota archaeon]|nr:HAD family hydrolase [Candidatus Thorarchaeota archaeon]
MSQFNLVKAILFDMHQTITDMTEGFLSLTRKVAIEAGFDLLRHSDDDLIQAFAEFQEWFDQYQIGQDVNIHFGNEVEHWTEPNRVIFRALGFEDIPVDTLISIEKSWRENLKTQEILNETAKSTMFELYNRGYHIGICTRRSYDPTERLRRWGLFKILSSIQWTSVPGYAKPHPFTLILAASEIGVNPLKCAYVGDSFEVDILAAQRASMIPILTTWARTDQAEKASEDIHIINEISELLDLFPDRN